MMMTTKIVPMAVAALAMAMPWRAAAAATYTFATLNDPSGTRGTYAYGINASGQVVGEYDDTAGIHGFTDTGGTFTSLIAPGAAAFTFANGVNNLGQIVGDYRDATGRHGFVYSKGAYQAIDDPAAFSRTAAVGINDAGQIVGFYDDAAGNSHGFLATPTTVPEPAGFALAAAGVAALAGCRRRRPDRTRTGDHA